MKKDPKLKKAQQDILDNLDALEIALDRCVDEGMLDPDSAYHNKIEDLIDETRLAKSFEELREVVTLAKTFEDDVDTWMALHGQSTVELEWPILE